MSETQKESPVKVCLYHLIAEIGASARFEPALLALMSNAAANNVIPERIGNAKKDQPVPFRIPQSANRVRPEATAWPHHG